MTEEEDRSSACWKANHANIKKFKPSELEEFLKSPYISSDLRGIIDEILQKRLA